jgi:hypothetical protein
MPKITLHGGPSNAWLVGEPGPELVALPDRQRITPDDTPEEGPSPGNSSETSSTKPSPSTKSGGSARRSRARTTENPSSTDPTDSSTAAGTDGAPTAATSEDEPGGGRP